MDGKTCGQCANRVDEKCYAPLPIWAIDAIDYLCIRVDGDDVRAEECECFEKREKEDSQ